jgi:FkbM family methyltransferase
VRELWNAGMSQAQKSEVIRGFSRGWRFLRKPLREKVRSIGVRWSATLAKIPKLIRLPFGAWWILRKDNVGEPLLAGEFETAELAFVERFLQPGMTVLDVGAHHGLYSLLASERVAAAGRVFAFEPSPRERRALRMNLFINLVSNVSVQGLALGRENGEQNLFVVQGSQRGCNSLRPPEVFSATTPIRVRVARLDEWLMEQGIDHVDFIKLDVEGAELDALKGGAQLFESRPRPTVLAEVQDVRTRPWGYPAIAIIDYLADRGYKWFRILGGGSVEPLDVSFRDFDGNFIACPEESLGTLKEMGSDPQAVDPGTYGSNH